MNMLTKVSVDMALLAARNSGATVVPEWAVWVLGAMGVAIVGAIIACVVEWFR